MSNIQVVFKCSGCKKRFNLSGFAFNRLGERFKSCLECKTRRDNKKINVVVEIPNIAEEKKEVKQTYEECMAEDREWKREYNREICEKIERGDYF